MSQVFSFALGGGMNLTGSPISVAPGEAIYCENFICAPSGGYRRIAGYERFDGRPAPSGGADAAAIAARRAAIQAVPGEGPIRGVHVFSGKVYAFRNAVGGASCVMWESSGAGWVSKKTGLAPNGKYRCINNNFKGSASSAMMYGVSGVHKAFQWDGTTWTDIATGMTSDTPKFIEAHKNYLWLGFANGSMQLSPLANPTGTWTVLSGANELGLGDEISNIISHKGVLVAYARNSIHILSGSSSGGSDPWALRTFTRGGGAFDDCARVIGGDVLAWDKPGASYLQASQVFGDFAAVAASDKIRSLAESQLPLFSIVSKKTGTYRAFCADGRVLVATFVGSQLLGWGQIHYDKTFACACVGEDAGGSEVMFAGGSDGFVYQLDAGTSFDGAAILSILRLAFNAIKSPTRKKRFRRFVLELSAQAPVTVRVQPDFDYGDFGGSTGLLDMDMWSSGGGGLLDVSAWDAFVFDAGTIGQATINISGVGTSIGWLMNHSSATDAPFTLATGHLHFDLWGLQR